MNQKANILSIDGSQGEGGGQVLRTSLSLSMITGQPFHMTGIRAGRRKPGLMRQHLTCVLAAKEISGAVVSGAELGSTEVTFHPKIVKGGDYTFAVGTAGSVTLVLQAVLPALLLAESPSKLDLQGGTHNPMAPCYDFLDRCFRPVLAKMGGEVSMDLVSHGFFPAGGGNILVGIKPLESWKTLCMVDSMEVSDRKGTVLLSHIPKEIGTRQVRMLKNKLNWPETCFEMKSVRPALGPGNAVILEVTRGDHVEVFTGFGGREITSGKLINTLIQEVRHYLSSTAPVGEHLADQLMLPLVLSGKGKYRAIKESSHTRTNFNVIEQFLPGRLNVERHDDGSITVSA
jgi:RNA 3'-terminal phosphate cyclase (ATP)